jgi:hypothetical protein
MADNQDKIAASLRELDALKAQLAAAETDEDKAVVEAVIGALEADLRWLGHKAAAPAKRAETRPAKAAEKR